MADLGTLHVRLRLPGRAADPADARNQKSSRPVSRGLALFGLLRRRKAA
jgi:hypothetical protein